MSPRIRPAAGIDRGTLSEFLRNAFHPAKADFLMRHGTWKHRGEEYQMILVEGDEILGYCGVIPVGCRVDQQVHDAVWWVDLVIDPKYRGKGLQTIFDDRIRAMTQLKLGFPNALAARIHRKHGWGVREDYETLLLPLRPRRMPRVRRASGSRGLMLRSAALLAGPAAAAQQRRLARSVATDVGRHESIDVARLSGVFQSAHPREHVTIERDPAHCAWRYADSPHRSELSVYEAGDSLAAVVRTVPDEAGPVARVLDLIGSIDREDLLESLLRGIGADAARSGASQVTLFSTLPAIGQAARRAGFRLPGAGRFCWYSDAPSIHRAIAESPHHWVFGDSDHDEPF